MSIIKAHRRLLAIIIIVVLSGGGYAAYMLTKGNQGTNYKDGQNTSQSGASGTNKSGQINKNPPDIKPGTKVQINETSKPADSPAEVEQTPQSSTEP